MWSAGSFCHFDPRQRIARTNLGRRLGGSQIRSSLCGQETNLLHLSEIEPRFLGRQVRNLTINPPNHIGSQRSPNEKQSKSHIQLCFVGIWCKNYFFMKANLNQWNFNKIKTVIHKIIFVFQSLRTDLVFLTRYPFLSLLGGSLVTAHPQVADGGGGLQIRSVAANILNK
jgi:hypothetical protein